MKPTLAPLAAIAAGLIALAWIAAGYLVSSPLALAATLAITAFYVAGALELRRVWRATRSLDAALAGLAEPPGTLASWLARIHPSLQHAVARRIEAGAGALPGPALAPYLVGLLVLLGMLGTFVGMVATLRGTGLALETATDIATIRASLAAPVQGLGLAFGTSVAGVAASAMLGLATTFVRRDRQRVARRLDDAAATTLHGFSRAHREAATFALLQRQAEALPALVERLGAMAEQLERQGRETAERAAAAQQQLHDDARQAQAALAATIEQQLASGLELSSRRAGEAMRPVVDATLAGVARQAQALHETVAATVGQQLDALAGRLDAATARMAEGWQGALARHAEAGDDAARRLGAALDGFAAGFEARSATLLQSVASAQAAAQRELVQTTTAFAGDLATRHDQATDAAARQMAGLASAFEARAATLLEGVAASHAALQTALAAADEQRLAAWSRTVEAAAAEQARQWEAAAALASEQQQRIGDALARTAAEIGAHSEAHARATLAEVERLLQAAAEAPQAAAEVVAGLRQQLSDSMARDNAALAERERLLQTVGTLLDAIQQAAGEQREAVDRLVGSAATMLERAGAGFAERIEAEVARIAEAAAQVSAGSIDVASLGEAFGQAVQVYGESNGRLMSHLQQIEDALERSLTRSDEQLAYYVAQARELIELSLASQQRILDELQQAAQRRAEASPEAAA